MGVAREPHVFERALGALHDLKAIHGDIHGEFLSRWGGEAAAAPVSVLVRPSEPPPPGSGRSHEAGKCFWNGLSIVIAAHIMIAVGPGVSSRGPQDVGNICMAGTRRLRVRAGLSLAQSCAPCQPHIRLATLAPPQVDASAACGASTREEWLPAVRQPPVEPPANSDGEKTQGLRRLNFRGLSPSHRLRKSCENCRSEQRYESSRLCFSGPAKRRDPSSGPRTRTPGLARVARECKSDNVLYVTLAICRQSSSRSRAPRARKVALVRQYICSTNRFHAARVDVDAVPPAAPRAAKDGAVRAS